MCLLNRLYNSLIPIAHVSDKKEEFYRSLREEMKLADKEDKLLERKRLQEKRMKEKMKRKKGKMEDEEEEDGEEEDLSTSEEEESGKKGPKRPKIYFDSESDGEENGGKAGFKADAASLEEQEALALKLLDSMNKS